MGDGMRRFRTNSLPARLCPTEGQSGPIRPHLNTISGQNPWTFGGLRRVQIPSAPARFRAVRTLLNADSPDVHGSPVMPPTVSVLCRGLVWRELATITRWIRTPLVLWGFSYWIGVADGPERHVRRMHELCKACRVCKSKLWRLFAAFGVFTNNSRRCRIDNIMEIYGNCTVLYRKRPWCVFSHHRVWSRHCIPHEASTAFVRSLGARTRGTFDAQSSKSKHQLTMRWRLSRAA